MPKGKNTWERCAYTLVVKCPTCGAEVGQRCITNKGKGFEAGWPHMPRVEDARKIEGWNHDIVEP